MGKQTLEIETGLSAEDRKLLTTVNTKLDKVLAALGGKAAPAAPAGKKGKTTPAPAAAAEDDDFGDGEDDGEGDDGEGDGEDDESDAGDDAEDDEFADDAAPTITRAEVNASLAAFAKASGSKSKAFRLLESVGGVSVLSELSEDKFAAVKAKADEHTKKAIAAAKAAKGGKKK